MSIIHSTSGSQVRARRAAPHPALDAVPRVFAAAADVEAEAIHTGLDIEQVRIKGHNLIYDSVVSCFTAPMDAALAG